MRRLLLAMMTLAAVISMAAPVSAQIVGVVLMHGNTVKVAIGASPVEVAS
jgi:hypothetical protein